LEAKGFEYVKNQIGFCGIWCGSCTGGNGAITELARRLDELIKSSNAEKWVPKEFDFNEFMKGLTCIQAAPLCSGCQKGGGDPTCKVRTCAQKKNIVNCSQCDALMGCKSFEALEQYYPKIKEDLKKIKNTSQGELVEKWTSELKTKWPHCILLCDATKK
jgi:hypothetical protein